MSLTQITSFKTKSQGQARKVSLVKLVVYLSLISISRIFSLKASAPLYRHFVPTRQALNNTFSFSIKSPHLKAAWTSQIKNYLLKR